MNKFWYIAFGVVCGFFFSGLILLLTLGTRGEQIIIQPPPTPEPLMVYITGSITSPGVYALEQGSRVNDVINLAGGVLPDADLSRINLVEPIYDGEKIYIPAKQEANLVNNTTYQSPIYPININIASQEELEQLPGIGPEKAASIVDYRNENGPFRAIEDIMNVPGIGTETFNRISNLISVY